MKERESKEGKERLQDSHVDFCFFCFLVDVRMHVSDCLFLFFVDADGAEGSNAEIDAVVDDVVERSGSASVSSCFVFIF